MVWLRWAPAVVRRYFAAARGCSPAAERGLPSRCGARASHCGGLSLWSRAPGHVGFSGCGSRAQQPRGTWNLPGPGIKSVSPALAADLQHWTTREVPIYFYLYAYVLS